MSWAIGRLPRKASLIVLTYHRITDPALVDEDPHLVSATPQAFETQMRDVKNGYRVVGLDEAIAHVRSQRSRGTAVLVTFDDGYRDNYEVAFPILRSLGLTATFFLTTSFIGSSARPWWDRIAYAVRHTSKSVISVGGRSLTIGCTDEQRLAIVRRFLREYYLTPGAEAALFVRRIEEACAAAATSSDRLFLNWADATEMLSAGMDIGGHTHTHPVLSRLGAAEQYEELFRSRQLLQQRLGCDVNACAYPVGTREAVDGSTIDAAKKAGYSAAFVFDQMGFNAVGERHPYSLSRLGVEPTDTQQLLQVRLGLLSTTGRMYF